MTIRGLRWYLAANLVAIVICTLALANAKAQPITTELTAEEYFEMMIDGAVGIAKTVDPVREPSYNRIMLRRMAGHVLCVTANDIGTIPEYATQRTYCCDAYRFYFDVEDCDPCRN